jgi:hypothetical protein
VKIRFLSGPKKGEVTHAPVTQQTQLLVDAGLVEVIPPEPLAPAVVSWGTKFDSFGNPMLIGNCSRACGVHRFMGRPENAHKWPFQHSCGAPAPTPVPPEVVQQYRKLYDGAKPSATGDDTKLINAKQYPAAIDRAADASFQKLYGRPRR